MYCKMYSSCVILVYISENTFADVLLSLKVETCIRYKAAVVQDGCIMMNGKMLDYILSDALECIRNVLVIQYLPDKKDALENVTGCMSMMQPLA
jgi:hypothetical protein